LSAGSQRDALHRLLSLLEDTDPASSGGLYEAQQEGMSLASAVFTFGSVADQDTVLGAAASLVEKLPTLADLVANHPVSKYIGLIELRSAIFTKLRQRVGTLAISVDGVPVPSGVGQTRRVFPIVIGDAIVVQSEVEMQFAYLLSTIVRLAAEHPPSAGTPLDQGRRAAMDTVFAFLLRDKVGFYWQEAAAWHWSGAFRNMRERVDMKLDAKDRRVTTPPWFGAMVDHELHLFGVAANLSATARVDSGLASRLTASDRSLLADVQQTALRMLHLRVTAGPHGDGFLIDYGMWTTNPSYAYAGCLVDRPIPAQPCTVPAVATDASHARRWPWWLESFAASWPPGSTQRAEIVGYERRLARQFARDVLRLDARGRPLTANFMDGRDGWYSLRDFPNHQWGFGPSSMSGSMRYGSWALLGPFEPSIAAAYRTFCRVGVSTDPDDVTFRIRYYGSASDKPELGGLGETDLYGPGSLYTLTCRIGVSLGLY
jgi:hypothetical protein